MSDISFDSALFASLSAIGPGSIPEWILATTALLGVWFAYGQLKALARTSSDQVNVARANLILEIDLRYESEHIQESRLAIRTLRNHCEKAARAKRPGANDDEVFQTSCRLFSEEMTKLLHCFKTADPPDRSIDGLARQPDDKDGNRYFTLMRLPYWMETVASLTRDGLLPEDDVLSLYDAVFTGTLSCFVQHINDRRTEGPARNDRLLEHALWLRERAIEREQALKKIQERAIKRPRKGTSWLHPHGCRNGQA